MDRSDWTFWRQYSHIASSKDSSGPSFTDYFPEANTQVGPGQEDPAACGLNGGDRLPSPPKTPNDLKLDSCTLGDTSIHSAFGLDCRDYTEVVNIHYRYSRSQAIQTDPLSPGPAQQLQLVSVRSTDKPQSDTRPGVTKTPISLWPLAWSITVLFCIGPISVLYFVLRR
jgi:hypothetical protein